MKAPCGRCIGEVLTTPRQYGRVEEPEEVGGLPQYEEVPGHGKASNIYDFVGLCSLASNLHCTCFNWQAVQATYRLEEAANDQSRTLELKRDKRLDATQALKNSEADLVKARKDLKEMTRARDSAESGLASTQKQAEDQTRRLLEAEDQL